MVIPHALLLSARRLRIAAFLSTGLALGLGFAGPGDAGAWAQSTLDARTPAIETPDVEDEVLSDEQPEVASPEGRSPNVARIEPTEPAPAVPAPATPRAPGTKGAFVFHGNYCGPGSRGEGLPPIDALDEACMHHDACSPPFGKGLPSCGCNARLTREAALIARRPGTPDDLRIAAEFVSEGAKALACR